MAQSVYEQFRDAALQSPNLPFLCYPPSVDRGYVAEGGDFLYGEMLGKVDAIARSYQEAGYQAGHRVALVLGNRPEHFVHLLALNSVGVTVVPLNPGYLNHEFAYGIDFADCALVVGAAPRMDDLWLVAAGLSTPVPVIDGEQLPDRFPSPAARIQSSASSLGDREAMIIYTSGTTGRPKGCIISNASCLAAGESYSTAGGVINFEKGRDRLYIPLPSYHMNVSIYTLNTMARLHSCMVMQDRFRASTWWSDIVVTRATCVHYMGIIPPLLLKAPFSQDERRHSVKFGQGAGIDPIVKEGFERRFGFPLVEAWGMTETSRAIQNSREPRDSDGRAFGRPRPPLEVRIADENDEPLPFGMAGELLVRAEGGNPRHGFFSGYLKQPEETEKAWRNGWFHTGDIAMQREDGMLFFIERRKNIIRRSGENIAAAEIEEALINHPEIESVAVMAVADELHDEEILACIVLMPGVDPSVDLARAIQERARDRLAPYKLPAWLAFIETIPVTGTQKVQKGSIFPEGVDPRTDPRSVDLRDTKRKRSQEKIRII
ncbi:crotonobetaine/carnitine-CoA ligase [Rhodoligotrophos appendicifer]|uniref:AMP-binding protein n=1 Tax=Rhodoligotrophos appendicifer TaxID=987056 RepID=UPI001185A642|nr:AMP-binding protein [Rhodoligotrophos appendicifer]